MTQVQILSCVIYKKKLMMLKLTSCKTGIFVPSSQYVKLLLKFQHSSQLQDIGIHRVHLKLKHADMWTNIHT
jgi:hypothetical protein